MSESYQEKMAHVARAIAEGRYRYTFHGAQQRIARQIHRRDVEAAAANGEIIEDYPDHQYGPACLFLGRTSGVSRFTSCARSGRPLTSSRSTGRTRRSGRRTGGRGGKRHD